MSILRWVYVLCLRLIARWKDKCGDKLFWHIKNKNPTPPWRTAIKTVRNCSILLTTWQYKLKTTVIVTPPLLITNLIKPCVTSVPLHRLYLTLPHTLLTCTTFKLKRSKTLPLHYLHYLKHCILQAEEVHTHHIFLTFIGRSMCVDARSDRRLCDGYYG
jgi:hypothetical protein